MGSLAITRTMSAAALGVALVLGSAGMAAADRLGDLTVSTEGETTTFTIRSVETGSQFIPKGGKPTDGFPDEAPKAGDAFTFTDDLSQGGKLVGTDKGTCTIGAGGDEITCDVAITFANGTIRALDTSPFDPAEEGSEPFTVPLTSGTGAYDGIDGTAHVVTNDDESQTITVEYTLEGDGQVSAVPAGGAATGGTAAAAKDPVEPTATKDGDETTIKVRATETSSQFIPKGGKPTDDFPDPDAGESPAVGDAFAFASDLTQQGTKVGTDKGECTLLAILEAAEDLRCDGTLTFANGTIAAGGTLRFVLGDEGKPFTVPITAGSGAYAGIKGTLTIQEVSEKVDDYTLKFTKHTGQVTSVPSGGAKTGGGATGNSDAVALLALSTAVIAAGAGIAGVGRLAGRRR